MSQLKHTLPKRRLGMGAAILLACSLGLMGCGVSTQGLIPGIGDSQGAYQNIGAVRLAVRADYQVMATKADVKKLRVTLSGGTLSAPLTQTVAYPITGDIAFDGVAPGSFTVKVEALDGSGAVIGSTEKAGVQVVAGQLTSVTVSLKLIPTQGSPGTGKIGVGVTIEDGDIVTTPLPSPSPSPTPTPAPVATPAPGTVTYGVNPSYVPTYDVKVAVGTLNQALLDKYPTGTRFALEAGVHRLSASLAPKGSQQILGYPGAVVNGSKVLTGWTQDGTRWYVGGQTQRLAGNSGESISNPMAGKSEDTFFDGKPLKQVDSLSALTAGSFFFDYTNSRIYLYDNPAGHTVETTVTAQAFKGGGGSVVLKNLVVEKFGNSAQAANAAITNGGATGWLVENCEVRYNHGMGVSIGDGGTVRGSKIHHQGQLGIGGGGSNILVEGNEIAYNNSEGFNSYWEAGGSKWVYTTGLIVRKNWAHHNYGPGLWTDIDNKSVTYENNVAEYNERSGIFHEISYSAIIRNNTSRGNGTNYKYWEPEGAGINITNSSGVEVYGNTVEDNAGGIIEVHATDRSRDTKDNYVHDNVIKMRKGYTGLVLAGPNQSATDPVFVSNNNRFVNNKYYVTNVGDQRWNWKGVGRTFTDWKSFGFDTTGSVSTY